VLLGGVETVSGAVIGAIVFKAANIWLVSQTDLSKLVLGGFIVLMVVAFPKGIVGTLETLRSRWRPKNAEMDTKKDTKSTLATSRVEVAE
jgi:branched-chain amino acid transport system permease protein